MHACTCISEIPLDWLTISFSFSQNGFHFFSMCWVSASREGHATSVGKPGRVDCTVQCVREVCIYVYCGWPYSFYMAGCSFGLSCFSFIIFLPQATQCFSS